MKKKFLLFEFMEGPCMTILMLLAFASCSSEYDEEMENPQDDVAFQCLLDNILYVKCMEYI